MPPLIDYVTVGSSSLSDELPGKQSPSPLPDITYLFRIILALGIAAATATIPIPLHYLSLSPLYYCTLPCPMLLRIITHQLALRPCQSAMLSYRAAITLGSDAGYLHYCNFKRLLDKVNIRVTLWCPREVLRRDDREDMTGVRCAWPLIVVRESYPLNHESRVTPRLLAR